MYGFIEKVHIIEMLVADLGEVPGGAPPRYPRVWMTVPRLSQGVDPALNIILNYTSFYLKCCVLSFLQLQTTNCGDLKGFTFNIYLSVYQRDFFSLIYKNSSYYYYNKSIFHITIHFLLIQTS